jgi:very-short-patch-repair endonuclease
VLPFHNIELKIVPNKIHPYNPELKLFAGKLRKNMTLGEILLWQEIRDKKLVYQFHRQVPLYKYIVDFFCHELQLAIEIDGSSHDHPEVSVSDLTRQEELESYGIQFLRFEEREVRKDINTVLNIIERWIEFNAN